MTQTNTDKTLSTERLVFLKLWAEQSNDEITLKASEVRELLASRTQSPAEWQVEAAAKAMAERRWHLAGSDFILAVHIANTWRDHIEDARAILRAASITPPAPERSKEEVGVKALVWGKTSYGRPEVETIVGVYRVFEHIDGGWAATLKTFNLVDSHGRKNFATEAEAIAAVEADYEQRILSALEPASLHKGEAGKHSDDCGCGYCT